MIPIFRPSHNKKKILKALSDVFSGNWLGQGPQVAHFEREFGKKFGFKYCVAVNSGTSALELAYHLLDIREGDEVVSTVFSCLATTIPLLRRKARVIFCDIERDTFNADPDDIARKISRKTKAIVVTKLGGIPLNPKIYKLARKWKIPVVIDAAQAVGKPEKNGKYVIFSFQSIKHFTTIDGGMLILRNKRDYKRTKKLRWFGIDRERKVRTDWRAYKLRRMTMETREPGYKFHMNDVAATLGLVGLKESDKLLAYRRKIVDYYKKNIRLPCIAGGSLWLFAILTEKRDELAKYLFEKGIDTNLVHIRNDISPVFERKKEQLPNMDYVEKRYLYLPLHTKLKMTDIIKITRVVNEFAKSHV